MTEKIYEYLEAKDFFNWEGERGVKQFEEVCKNLGYVKQPFLYGDPIHQFLADNSGVFEALFQWINEQNVKEWEEVFGAT